MSTQPDQIRRSTSNPVNVCFLQQVLSVSAPAPLFNSSLPSVSGEEFNPQNLFLSRLAGKWLKFVVKIQNYKSFLLQRVKSKLPSE